MPKLSPRDELIVEIVAVVLIAVALAMLLVRPQLGALSEIETQRAAEELSIKNAQAELELLRAAKAEALQTQADLIKVGNQVPDTPQLPSVVVQIQDLANEAGISFVQIKPKEMEAAGEYTSLPLELTLRGQFFDLVDFLYRLEHLPRETRVTRIELTQEAAGSQAAAQAGAAGSETPAVNLQLKVNANVFVMGNPTGGAGGTTGAPGATGAPAATGSAPSQQ